MPSETIDMTKPCEVANAKGESLGVAHVTIRAAVRDGKSYTFDRHGVDLASEGFVLRNVPAARCTNGEPLEVGDVAATRKGDIARIEEIAPTRLFIAAWFPNAGWVRQANGCELDGHMFNDAVESTWDLVRPATPSDFPDTMPLDQVPVKYRGEVEKLRERKADADAAMKWLKSTENANSRKRCTCWFSLNTGPNGECETCGGVRESEWRRNQADAAVWVDGGRLGVGK